MIALPRYRVFYGTTAALELPVLAFRCLVAWQARWGLYGFYRGPSTALPRISGTYYRATEPRGIPRYRGPAVALPRAT